MWKCLKSSRIKLSESSTRNQGTFKIIKRTTTHESQSRNHESQTGNSRRKILGQMQRLGKWINQFTKQKRINITIVKSSFSHCCADYAKLWKLSFNPLKSSCYPIKPVDYEFILNGGSIPKSERFIYFGLPVGTEAFVEAFYNEKMSKCEKAASPTDYIRIQSASSTSSTVSQLWSLALNLCTFGFLPDGCGEAIVLRFEFSE